MSRTLVVFALASVLVGCTRYGTRANGPFAPRVKSDPTATIPPGPPPNNSPLTLATDPPLPPDQNRAVVPMRLPEPAALGNGNDSGVITAGGSIPTEDDAAFPPLRRRKPDGQPTQMPSPYASPTQSGDGANPPTTGPKNLAELKKVVQVASERWAKVETYQATLIRKEVTPKDTVLDEVVFFQYRKQPMSVFTRNIQGTGKDREVVYNPGKYGDKMYLMLGEGDAPRAAALLGFGVGFKPPAMSPDDPRVTESGRYSVRDAGWGYAIGRIADVVAKYESGKYAADRMVYLGQVTRPELKEPLVGIQVKLMPGDDPLMPKGGTRQWLFDMNPNSQAYGMPVLMMADDPKGKSVEYYLYEKVKMPAGLTEADFNPDRLGKKK